MSHFSSSTETGVNLPLPILPKFDSDQLATVFGTCFTEGAFLLECESGNLVAVNQRLLQLLGRDLKELEED